MFFGLAFEDLFPDEATFTDDTSPMVTFVSTCATSVLISEVFLTIIMHLSLLLYDKWTCCCAVSLNGGGSELQESYSMLLILWGRKLDTCMTRLDANRYLTNCLYFMVGSWFISIMVMIFVLCLLSEK